MKCRFGIAATALAMLLSAPLAEVSLAAELPDVWALTNARVVTAPGKVFTNGTVIVREGIIAAVGATGAVAVPADATEIDLAGKTVYPGLIDPFVTLGRLAGKKEKPGDEDEAAESRRPAPSPTPAPERAGNVHPVSRVTPEKRASAEVRVDPEALAALRAAGFTLVQAVPDAGIFRGECAVLSLGDGPVSKNLVSEKTAQLVSMDAPDRRGPRDYPASKMGVAAVVRQTFSDARWFREAEAAWKAKPSLPRPDRVEAWAALGDAVSGSERVLFEAPDVLALLRAGRLAREFGLRARYVGGGDAYLLMDEVKALAPEIVLTLDFPPVPAVDDDDDWADVPLQRLRRWDRAPSNPRWLRDAGISFALTTYGLEKVGDVADRVRKAEARGLSADEVLAAFTTIPAKMLGLEARAGRIAPGKAANLVVVDGTLFGEKSRVVTTWVDGLPYDVKPKKGALPGTYRVDGARLEVRTDPKSGALQVSVTPEGGKSVAAAEVSRHGPRAEFEIDGVALGLAPGTAAAVALVEGDALTLRVTRGEEKKTLHGFREKHAGPAGRGGAEAGAEPESEGGAPAAAEPPEPDVRPLPARFATALLAPKAVLVKSATIWTSGPQGIFETANLLVVDGKVAAVGPDAAVPPALAGSAFEIDGDGKVVTPGLVDAHSHTGIDGNVNEWAHNVSAEVRIADVIEPLDVAIYRELAGGLTAANVLHGSANAIGGQNAVVKLRWGEGPDGLVLAGAPPGIKFALGENPKQSNWRTPRPRYPQTRMGVSALIRERFLAARDYRRRQMEAEAGKKRGETVLPVRTDLQLEAIAEVLEGKRAIHAHAYVKQEILDLIRVCEEFGVKIGTFQHALDGYKVADEIAAHGAGASLFSDWWGYKFEVYDAIPYAPALMRERGVLVTLNSDSDELARRLNLEAAKAVKYGGVPREEALKFVTWNAAKQLGLEKRIGSLEPGKDGDFVLWSGDPLDTRTLCLQTWIDGKKYFDRDTDLRQRALLGAEKSDLIAKARAAAARGAPTAGGAPPERRPEEHDCGRLDETSRGEVVR
ncbi:MAG: amidohydrolase family protein [Acidithiobacillales bacterium]